MRDSMQPKTGKPNGGESYVVPIWLCRVNASSTLDGIGIPRTRRAAWFHTFRHSAATIVNQKTGNSKLVQKLHSSLSTTGVYTNIR